MRALLPAAPADANKGTFGKVLIVGGSVNYIGAPGLSARAAYRSGAGLVTVGAPAPIIAALAGHLLEITWLLLPHDMGVALGGRCAAHPRGSAQYDALLIGPGWGREKTTRDLLAKLLDRDADHPTARRAIGFSSTSAASEDQAGNWRAAAAGDRRRRAESAVGD